jgi:phage terminase Nu1 subunit (DNA packaging protein)
MGTESKPPVMSQAEYARHRGKSRQYISKLAQAGVLVMRGGKVDVRASDTVLDDRPVDVVEERASAPQSRPVADSLGGQTSTSFGQARTVEMVFRAKLRKLEFETRQGKLIEAELVRKTISDAARGVRDGILAIPDRLATVLAAESDPKKVHVTLKTELSRELEALANAIDAV